MIGLQRNFHNTIINNTLLGKDVAGVFDYLVGPYYAGPKWRYFS